MTQEIREINEKCIAIVLEVSLCSGRKRLSASDLGEGIDLPPDTLASLGSKKILDPKTLKVFNTKKCAAERLLHSIGPKGMLGRNSYLVPYDRFDEVKDELEAIKTAFYAARDEFKNNYNKNLESWLADNEEWRTILEGSLMSVEEVIAKISFRYHGFSFSESTHPSLKDSLGNKMSGLTGRLLKETAQVAKDSFEKSFKDKDNVTKRSLTKLKTVRDKLAGFAPFQPKLAPLVEDIDSVLNSVPDNGQPIVGNDLINLRGILMLLMNVNEVSNYAEKRLAGRDGDDLFGEWKMDNGLIKVPSAALNEQPGDQPLSLPYVEDEDITFFEEEPNLDGQAEEIPSEFIVEGAPAIEMGRVIDEKDTPFAEGHEHDEQTEVVTFEGDDFDYLEHDGGSDPLNEMDEDMLGAQASLSGEDLGNLGCGGLSELEALEERSFIPEVGEMTSFNLDNAEW